MRNSVGLSTPPCIAPDPIFTSLYRVFIFVYLYSHSIVLIRSSSISNFLIFWNRSLWFTVSNADFKSTNIIHNLFSCWYSYFSLIYSVSLNRFISQPIPFLNPVCPSFSYHYLPQYSYQLNLSLSIVSSSLQIGDVFVIGLALQNVFHSLSSFGIYICSSKS